MHMYLLETFKIVNNNYFTLKSPRDIFDIFE